MATSRNPGRTQNPLYTSPHKLKLGTFATNVSGAGAISTAEGLFDTTWPNVMELADMADRAGFEAIVPVARWRGFGGASDFNARCYETFTWAAGIGAQTTHPAVFSTCHVPTIHPIVAAKQATTIDHITGGRFILNVVCGWFNPEMEMFGAPVKEHELRYDYAEEWIEIVKRLWTAEEGFDHIGRFFTIKDGIHLPKPIQDPFPPIMQAGGSPRGIDFAAKHANIAFVHIGRDLEAGAKQVEHLRTVARDKYGRELQVWNITNGVIADTDEEAAAYFKYYVEEKGDRVAADNLIQQLGMNSQTVPAHVWEAIKDDFIAGWGGYQVIGTPDTVVDRLTLLPEIGIDGTLLVFARFRDDLRRFISDVVPRLEDKGLREAVAADSHPHLVGS
jgi:alkanesulfonate monooxygenase SsuD/methylene tetrahydromethanopterin reductase-like flavin-dependent oxidoreductase (luciferase family)